MSPLLLPNGKKVYTALSSSGIVVWIQRHARLTCKQVVREPKSTMLVRLRST